MTDREENQGDPQTTAAGMGTRSKVRYTLLRPARDACIAFGMFVLATLSLSSDPSSATPSRLLGPGALDPSASTTSLTQHAVATTGEQQIFNAGAKSSSMPTSARTRQTDTAASWLLLSLAFSILAALNMALVRHLRVAYANPRKSPKI